MNNTIIKILCLFLLLIQNSCGYEDFGHISTPPPPYKKNGIYTGTLTNNGINTTFSGIFINKNFIAVHLSSGTIYTNGPRDITPGGNTLFGQLDVLSLSGGTNRVASISANFTSDNVLSGSIIDQSINMPFQWSLDTIYNRTANTTLAGTYSAISSGTTITITSDNAGVFNGSDTDGCTYSGTQTPFDTQYNLYQLTLTVANCGTNNGTYSGYAFNDDSSSQNDVLAWIVDDKNYVLALSMLRQ